MRIYRHNYSAPDVTVCKYVYVCVRDMDNVRRQRDFSHLINARINGITQGA